MSVEAVEAAVTSPAPAERDPRSLYKYATWIHVGHGADECTEVDEQAGTNQCADTSHFHAWCRIPNPLQEREIRERALAGKARKIRQLRSQGSDANEILETELESLQAEPDATERMAAELVGADWAPDYLSAVRQVRELDDPDGDGEDAPKLFAHIEDDQARFARLEAATPEERAQDEFEELRDHVAAYQEKVREAFEAITNPKRETYEQMDAHDLLDLTRRKRIERGGTEEFMHQFSVQEWLSCTYRAREGDLAFRDLKHLEGADPEVLLTLESTFADLEKTAQSSSGN